MISYYDISGSPFLMTINELDELLIAIMAKDSASLQNNIELNLNVVFLTNTNEQKDLKVKLKLEEKEAIKIKQIFSMLRNYNEAREKFLVENLNFYFDYYSVFCKFII